MRLGVYRRRPAAELEWQLTLLSAGREYQPVSESGQSQSPGTITCTVTGELTRKD